MSHEEEEEREEVRKRKREEGFGGKVSQVIKSAIL
jgi:hypothetical protein